MQDIPRIVSFSGWRKLLDRDVDENVISRWSCLIPRNTRESKTRLWNEQILWRLFLQTWKQRWEDFELIDLIRAEIWLSDEHQQQKQELRVIIKWISWRNTWYRESFARKRLYRVLPAAGADPRNVAGSIRRWGNLRSMNQAYVILELILSANQDLIGCGGWRIDAW